MKTKRERNKQLEFLQAYSNPTSQFICFKGGRHCGKTFLHNLMIQEQNAHKQLNSMLQANMESPTARIPTVKIKHNSGFYSAICPSCDKVKILCNELNTLTAVCNKCYTPFKLYK